MKALLVAASMAGGLLLAGSANAATLFGEAFSLLGASHSLPLSVSVEPIPEPSTWAMMITGIAFVGAAMRVARRKAAESLAAA